MSELPTILINVSGVILCIIGAAGWGTAQKASARERFLILFILGATVISVGLFVGLLVLPLST
jgi:uncharacterized membrane protein